MYQPKIGLEIHTELKTKTKMFCGCLNNSEEKNPNINVCPVCLAHPGALPTINKEAVEAVLKVGLALNSQISQSSKFDRKNYFYPDLPKGYQISQYDAPLCLSGYLDINLGPTNNLDINNKKNSKISNVQKSKRIKIRRIHLEEDTGRLIHSLNGDSNATYVDFNRAGVPLMELVTEPDIESAEEALSFVKELQLILRYLDVSSADMEKGEMRCEVNISLCEIADCEIANQYELNIDQNRQTYGSQKSASSQYKSVSLSTKVEIKNLNSFRAVEESIAYEIKRQEELLEKGEKIIQETRGWDDVKKITISQRIKEEAHDYRYFPEPDLPPLDLTKFGIEGLKRSLSELPEEKRRRFMKEYGLSVKQVEILITDRLAGKFFEEAVSELQTTNYKLQTILYNYLTSDLFGLMSQNKVSFKELKITPENFAELIDIINKGEISTRTAKDVLKIMLETGRDPSEIIESEGLKKISDEAGMIEIVKKVMSENPKPVEDYKKGKENALQFLIGKAMAELKGRGDPEMLKKIFKDELI